MTDLLVIFLPCVIVAVSAVIVKSGTRIWTPTLTACTAVLVGAFYLRRGVIESCIIDESECLGATAFAWIIAIFWGLFCAGFAVCFVSAMRRRLLNSKP